MKKNMFLVNKAIKTLLYSIKIESFKYFNLSSMLPSNVLISTTYMCNSRCKMCNVWKKYKNNSTNLRGEMTVDEFFEFVNKNRFLTKIALTGGEPFLRNDLYDMIIFLDSKGYNTEITTNAILLNKIKSEESRILENLSGNVPHNLSVSIDGLERSHDYLRGVTGIFRKATDLLRWSIEQTKKYDFFETSISHTITESNYKEFPRFFYYFINFGLRPEQITFRVAHRSLSYFENNKSKEIPKNTPKLIEKIQNVMGKFDILRSDPFYRYLIQYLKNTNEQVIPCSSALSFCYIDPYWNVFPCISWSRNIGNLRECDFDLREFWKSESVLETRNLVKNDKCPNCWTQCSAIPSMNSNILILLKRYWSILKTSVSHYEKHSIKQVYE